MIKIYFEVENFASSQRSSIVVDEKVLTLTWPVAVYTILKRRRMGRQHTSQSSS
ncbi:MAG: hypothetical protein N3D13_09720 [Thermaurantimonas aggregans]|nr:hypothetical protein [Thermaurantimonas aggregans]MCX8149540.1 hypothetical protein [Thermaurantimonas aggregans]